MQSGIFMLDSPRLQRCHSHTIRNKEVGKTPGGKILNYASKWFIIPTFFKETPKIGNSETSFLPILVNILTLSTTEF